MVTQGDRSTPVLVLHHSDGFVEVFGRNIDVHFLNLPPASSPRAEARLEEYVRLALPTRYRLVYDRSPRQAVHFFEKVSAAELAEREAVIAFMRVEP